MHSKEISRASEQQALIGCHHKCKQLSVGLVSQVKISSISRTIIGASLNVVGLRACGICGLVTSSTAHLRLLRTCRNGGHDHGCWTRHLQESPGDTGKERAAVASRKGHDPGPDLWVCHLLHLPQLQAAAHAVPSQKSSLMSLDQGL